LVNADFSQQFFPGAVIRDQFLDLLAEVRNVGQRALERPQGFAQFQKAFQFGNRLRDGFGTEVV